MKLFTSFLIVHFINIYINYISIFISGEGVLDVPIVVNNRVYEKKVGLLLTFNDWKTFRSIPAEHIISKDHIDIFLVEEKITEILSLDVSTSRIEFVAYCLYDEGHQAETVWSENPQAGTINHTVSI